MEVTMINSLKNVLPILGELIQDDVSTCITDREKCIAVFINSKVPVAFNEGDKVPTDNPLFIAMEKNGVFSVVAQEMRKLSQNSNESSKKVMAALVEMKKSIDAIMTQVNEANTVAGNHSAATEKMNTTIDEIITISKTLVDETKNL